MMKHLRQTDPKWAKVLIGPSKISVARMGCTLTCISMLSSYFGEYMDPGTLASHKDWFLEDARVLWKKLGFEHFHFVWREYERNDNKIKEYLKDPNKAVLLEVNHGAHWVLATDGNAADYHAVDPLTGTKINVLLKYGNITGAAYFEGAPILPPENEFHEVSWYSGKFIKSFKPDVYYFNGFNKFKVPDWSTYTELFKDRAIEEISDVMLANIPVGQSFPSMISYE